MYSSVTLRLTTYNDYVYVLDDVLNFRLVREYYTPYSTLRVEAVSPEATGGLYKKVELLLDGTVVHCGLVDTATINRVPDGFDTLTVRSKSFTVLLCQNQLEPGIKPNVSLGSLIDSFISVPEVSYQSIDDTVNYIYVKSSSTLWDAVVNLTHKLNGGHPYVCESNRVMVSLKEDPYTLNLPQSVVTSTGTGLDTTKMVSHIHMQDVDGNYDTYNLDNPTAVSLNVVRHKHIELDRQYLSNPQDALVHKVNFSMRGYYFVYATYDGYQGEDIGDYVNLYNYYQKSRVSRLEVTGVDGNVSTKVYAYTDNYLTYG
jgi:hypothetical protein